MAATIEHRSPQRPRRFPASDGARLRAALSAAHRARPFLPDAPREAARRVLAIAEDVGLSGHIARGGLDLGGVELDHLWAVVDRRVVDVTLPVLATDFVNVLRGYVAGDVGEGDLVDAATAYELEWRVVGDVPPGCRYLGRPILAHRRRV